MRRNPLSTLAATSPADVVDAAVSRVAAASGLIVGDVARVAAAHDAERVAAQALASERLRRGREMGAQAPRGAVDDEPVVPLDVQGAKEAVIGMVRDLADMPPPDRKDDVGFSAATDSPLRAFLARTGGSATHDPLDLMGPEDRAEAERNGVRPLTARDWLRAARLLLVHSKSQVPRALVLGAIRALEAETRAAPLPPRPKVSDVSGDDYQILGQGAVTAGELAAKGGAAKWQPWRPEGAAVKGARVLTLPGDLAQRVLADARRDDARGKVLTTAPGLGANQVLVIAEGDGAAAAAVVRDALLAASPDDAPLARRVAAVVEASATDTAGLDLRGALDRAKPPMPAAPAAAAGAPPKGDAFPDAPLPAGRVPADVKAGHAGPPDRKDRSVISDFDSVKWRWDGGPLVYLALSRVSTTEGWKPLNQVSGELKSMIRGEARKEARGQYYDLFWPFNVTDMGDVARIMGKHYRATVAPQELKRLGAWWAYLANGPSVADPLARGKAGFERGVRWAYVPEENVVELTLPFDEARGKGDQIVAAMKNADVLYRRVGETGGSFWITAENVGKLIAYMESSGRLAASIPLLRELLPYWRQLAVMFERKGTRAEIEKAESLLRRLRFTMEPTTVRAVYERISAFAPYLAGVKPGTAKMDLGPYGTWAVVNRGSAQNPKEFIDIYMLGMSPEVRKLAREEIESERPARDKNNNIIYLESGRPKMKRDYGYAFPIESLEKLAHALDRSGLMPLAMSLRGALLVDEAGRNCAVQDALASATTLDSITLPEARALVADVAREAPAVLAPGVKLREYQAIGIAFMRANQYHAILGDEPGLGKTLQVLTALALAPDKLPALIIAPTSVVGVWAREARIFTPGLTVRTARATAKVKIADAIRDAIRSKWDLLVIGWDSLRLASDDLIAAADAHRWRTVIMDEAHSAKNRGAQRGQIAEELAKRAPGGVIAVTGTLVENDPDEAWSILDMVVPGVYGTKTEYRKKYSNAKDRQVTVFDATTGQARTRVIKRFERPSEKKPLDPEDAILSEQDREENGEGGEKPPSDKDRLMMLLAELRVALRCDMIRRLKDEVFTQLPPLLVDLVPVSLDAAQADAYGAVMDALPEWINNAVRYDIAQKAAEQIAAAQSVGEAVGPELALQRALMNRIDLGEETATYGRGERWLDYERVNEAVQSFKLTRSMVAFGGLRRLMGEYKAPVVLDMADEYIRTHDTPLLIFAEHKPVVAFLRDNLARKGHRVGVVTGETPPPRRDVIVENFQNGGLDVLIGSTALRQGVTLTAADEAIFAEIWWNPAWINQAEMRIHRADDRTLAKKSVRIQHVYAENTVDEAVANTVIEKREIIDAVLGGIVGASPEAQLMQKVMGKVLKRANATDKDDKGKLIVLPTPSDMRAALKGTLKAPKKLNAGEVIVGEAAIPAGRALPAPEE